MSFPQYTRSAYVCFREAKDRLTHARNTDDFVMRKAWVIAARRYNRIGVQWLKNARQQCIYESSNERL